MAPRCGCTPVVDDDNEKHRHRRLLAPESGVMRHNEN